MIYALHGFLGRPHDFRPVMGADWICPDYLRIRELSPSNGFDSWGAHFNSYVLREAPSDSKRILLGYSQGGRLALHAMKADPNLWSGLILLSVNPGISPGERPSRLRFDESWAKKFEQESFQKVIAQWNSLPVFNGTQTEPVRNEADYNNHQLAECLRTWSLGRQDDFRDFLWTLSCPLLYLCGDFDQKYMTVGHELSKNIPHLHFASIPQSGHRVLFDRPALVKQEIESWLRSK